MFSFRLNEAFVASYTDRPVAWGFTDVAGNSFSELTFLDKYSRLKDDGSKETWVEVCERVANGTYSIQKDHAKAQRLPWNDHKAQRSAQEFFERMFAFKFTPPGRGLWGMGTALVNVEKNSAALQNCFRGDTEIITRDGVAALEDLVGQTIEVPVMRNDSDDEFEDWAKATVEFFGVQPIQKVIFRPTGMRSNHRIVEHVTPDHRWELGDGNSESPRLTTALKVGDVVPAFSATDNYGDCEIDVHAEAFRHGMIFADGSINYHYENGDYSHVIRLCGRKARYAGSFDHVLFQPNCNGDPVAYHRSATNMKQLPDNANSDYIGLFIAGWAEFDGSRKPAGTVALSTQNAEAVDWLLRNAAAGGYFVIGHSISSNTETNYGPRSAPLHIITLRHWAGVALTWTVDAIEAAGEGPVYCAVVPDKERFTLASGIYTSNCAFVSTASMKRDNPAAPFAFLMEASMLGVGVGFDTLGSKRDITIAHVQVPEGAYREFALNPDTGRALPPGVDNGRAPTVTIPDTREGWAESTCLLLNTFIKGGTLPIFDYSEIREEGAPIKTFGGTAAGPQPLWELHISLIVLLINRGGTRLTSLDIVDIGNLIGVCVVAGNVRRSAELALGEVGDELFMRAKQYGDSVAHVVGHEDVLVDRQGEPVAHPENVSDESFDNGDVHIESRPILDWQWEPGPANYRKTWGWMSNNSISVTVGSDYDPYLENVALNGEPGFVWLDVARTRGRMADPPDTKDSRVDGMNPCAEQPLEGGQDGQGECCTLVETYLPRAESLEDYCRTLKFAFMYAKTVTLMPTEWAETNQIMQRNRRIGTSASGIAEFADTHGLNELKTWFNKGYETIRYYDRIYSEWLCVRESNRVTTVKPSGTVSLLAGVTPGVHWMPGGEYFLRAQRLATDSVLVPWLRMAGYTVEPDLMDPRRVVAYFPIHHPGRPEAEVSMWEKAMLAVAAQRYWSDNAVSVTVSFDPEREGHQIGHLMRAIEGQLKTISFLPMGDQVYAQQPYTKISKEEYEAYAGKLMPVDFSSLYKSANAQEAEGESYCSNGSCEVPVLSATG